LDKPCRSPDCSPDRDPDVSRENTEPRSWFFFRVCFLSTLAAFPLIVFFKPFLLCTDLLGAAALFADFSGVLPFRACFFVGLTFPPAVLLRARRLLLFGSHSRSLAPPHAFGKTVLLRASGSATDYSHSGNDSATQTYYLQSISHNSPRACLAGPSQVA
jgi:hypothetical protein